MIFFYIFMSKKRGYVFLDFDGTISDSKSLAYESLVSVLDDMDFRFSRFKLSKLMGVKIEKVFDFLGFDDGFFEKVKSEFYNKLVEGINLKGLKFCKDVLPLKDLKKKGVRLVIVSNSHHEFLDGSIKSLGIEDLFYEVYGSEDFDTKDKILKKLAKRYGLNPSECFYVGDRFSDIVCARKAGFVSVAINNECSWSTRKEILAEKPDFIVYDFNDLREVFLRVGFLENK